MSNLCIIPARGGSKRIPRKNIKDFLGKPIIAYSIELALECGLFDEVMVSTDDVEIAEIAKQYGAKIPFFRSESSSNDFATTMSVLNDVVNAYSMLGQEFNNLCCIYPTAVLASIDDLVTGYKKLENSEMVMPVTEFSFPPLRSFKLNANGHAEFRFPENTDKRSQDLEPWYHDAGQWYWYRTNAINTPLDKIEKKVIIKSINSVQDIDNLADWRLAELKVKLNRNEF